jgi:hypothetical protein
MQEAAADAPENESGWWSADGGDTAAAPTSVQDPLIMPLLRYLQLLCEVTRRLSRTLPVPCSRVSPWNGTSPPRRRLCRPHGRVSASLRALSKLWVCPHLSHPPPPTLPCFLAPHCTCVYAGSLLEDAALPARPTRRQQVVRRHYADVPAVRGGGAAHPPCRPARGREGYARRTPCPPALIRHTLASTLARSHPRTGLFLRESRVCGLPPPPR